MPRTAAVTVGTAMTAARRQRTRQLLSAKREPGPWLRCVTPRVASETAALDRSCPNESPVAPSWAGLAPVWLGPAWDAAGTSGCAAGGDAELPPPAASPGLVTDRLRTALAPRQQGGRGHTHSYSLQNG